MDWIREVIKKEAVRGAGRCRRMVRVKRVRIGSSFSSIYQAYTSIFLLIFLDSRFTLLLCNTKPFLI